MNFRDLFVFSRASVDRAFKAATLWARVPGFTLLRVNETAEPNTSLACGHGKLLIIISRHAGKAHERNKTRRRIKEIYYRNQMFSDPVQAIIILRRPGVELPYTDLERLLIKAFAKKIVP